MKTVYKTFRKHTIRPISLLFFGYFGLYSLLMLIHIIIRINLHAEQNLANIMCSIVLFGSGFLISIILLLLKGKFKNYNIISDIAVVFFGLFNVIDLTFINKGQENQEFA